MAQELPKKFHRFGNLQFANIFDFSSAMALNSENNTYECLDADIQITYSPEEEEIIVSRISSKFVVVNFKMLIGTDNVNGWYLISFAYSVGFVDDFSTAAKTFLSNESVQASVYSSYQRYEVKQRVEMLEIGDEILNDLDSPQFIKDIVLKARAHNSRQHLKVVK